MPSSTVAALAPTAQQVTATPSSQATAAATPVAAAPAAGEAPRFTQPTKITNPYYPVSLIRQAISLGMEGGKPFRTEVTLLPGTRTVNWNGQRIEALVSQYVSYSDGKLAEVAYDTFAQADNGGVYYLGEDVTNYQDGQVADHSGSWDIEKNGAPPALIMPAHPQVGQKFNPENLPGVAYETDEVMSLSEKVNTPDGPRQDGLQIKEVLMDGSVEGKVNAPNYGIVVSTAEDENVNLVWLQRSDAKPGAVPDPVAKIEAQAEDIADIAPGGYWDQVTTDVTAIKNALGAYQTQAANDKVPQAFLEAMTSAQTRLQSASADKDATSTLQAANDLSAAVADVSTVYASAMPADLGRLDVIGRQVALDAAAKRFTAAADDLARANAIWVRLKPEVLAHNGAEAAKQFEGSLSAQAAALQAQDAAALTDGANNALALVDTLENLF